MKRDTLVRAALSYVLQAPPDVDVVEIECSWIDYIDAGIQGEALKVVGPGETYALLNPSHALERGQIRLKERTPCPKCGR